MLSFSGIPLRDDSLPIKLSVLTSTYHRVSQIRRSLYCLAKQDWREFEVLVCDDGDNYDLSPIWAEFEPYLRLRIVRRERAYWRSDPTGGFRALLPLAKGEIVAIMQPEIMLCPEACRYLYMGHFEELPGTNKYYLAPDVQGPEKWVALKIYFLCPDMQKAIDGVDWQASLDNLKSLPNFSEGGCGLSNKSNAFWSGAIEFPWWFVGSTKKESGIWNFPEYLGHASIDFWLLGYRTKHHFMDIVPFTPLGYHQDHQRFSFAPDDEAASIGVEIDKTL